MKNMKILPRLMLAFGLKLMLFLILLIICYRGFAAMIEAKNLVRHTDEVIKGVDGVYADLLNIQTGMRGFALTGMENFLEPRQKGAAALPTDIGAIMSLTADNPNQQNNIEVLRKQSRQWLETVVNPVIALRLGGAGGSKTDQAVREFIASELGNQLFDGMRDTLENIRVVEERLLEKRNEEMRSIQEFTQNITLWGGAALVLFGAVFSFFLSTTITWPLAKITDFAKRITAGESALSLDIEQMDEIGVLAGVFRDLQQSLHEKTRVAEAIATGDLNQSVNLTSEKDTLGNSINRMVVALHEARRQSERMDWIKTGLNDLAVRMIGETDPRRLADKALGFLTPYLNAQGAALYLLNEEGQLSLQGGYASRRNGQLEYAVSLGVGLVGQAAAGKEMVAVSDIPEDCLRVNSSFGDIEFKNILALPLVYQDILVGVLELGAFEAFSEQGLDLLRLVAEPLAVAFDFMGKRAKVRELLERTQEQQEELKVVNEELEEHTQVLRSSEEELKHQREELQTVNEELEEKNEALERQKALIQEKNNDLEKAWQDVERKAAELEVSSRYKSEFLANMSHELRTPLNSLLLLARSLRDNASGRLSPDDVEDAGIIYKSGNDLLNIINDILDLSKIEAGKVSITQEAVPLAELAASIMMDFKRMAEDKGLDLRVSLDERLPPTVRTDRQRLEQILRNLVSNAVKFTEKGGITLGISRPEEMGDPLRSGLEPDQTVLFVVTDTGIGIPAEKHQEIFEAFQQADGSTSRRFGGTGLGLSISRELALLLGGEIALASEPGAGSAFTLRLPIAGASEGEGQTRSEKRQGGLPQVRPAAVAPTQVSGIPDDREAVGLTDKAILVIEDDPHFATIIRNLCHDKGFKVLVAATGEEGLALAERFLPMGIILDITLPGISGWNVLSSLKANHKVRHIPVHVISANEASHEALVMGAMGFLAKPVAAEDLERAFEQVRTVAEKKVKDLLLVEDNADLRRGILKLLGGLDLNVTEAETGREAMEALHAHGFDCMILDLGLADMSGFELLERLEHEPGTTVPPVIVYTGKDLSRDEEVELRKYAESIIIKGARSEERLLDETTLFLHRMVNTLPQDTQRMIIDLHNRDAVLEGRKVLIVDDDMRNLFAVSRVLTEKGLKVVKAENGATALRVLEADPGVDIVLMDIMMPGMDGYETMRRIRRQPQFAKLPILALTAKAMKEDRAKCIEAGASDYLAKPVDVDRMLSMLRVWLYSR